MRSGCSSTSRSRTSTSRARFAPRLFVYNYRIYDRYRRTVVTLSVLGDERTRWRSQQFGYELWGSQMAFRFPIVKLSDYVERWSELEASENPFATVVMSHLKAQETRGDARERKVWKLSLTRGLYERGYARQDILNVFRFVDWVLGLPEELEREFWQEIERYEEERNMPYITSVERMATARGIEQGIEQGSVRSARQSVYDALDVRFGEVPVELRARLEEIADAERLRQLYRDAIVIPTLADFEQLL